jgi:hypothetical protein
MPTNIKRENLIICGIIRSRIDLNIESRLPYLDYVEDTICDTKQGATDDQGVSDA